MAKQTNITPHPELISVLGFSKLYNLPYPAVQRLIKKKMLHCEQIGKLLFVNLDKLAATAERENEPIEAYLRRKAKYSCKFVRGGLC